MKRSCFLLLFGWLMAAPALAEEVEEESIGAAVERHLTSDAPFRQWVHDPEAIEEEAGDRVETREVAAAEPETVKLTDLVPPIRFESGVADIPQSTVDELRNILESMQHRQNVRLHLVGHADDQPLSDALVRVFGDNEGLSRERAGEVAELFQRALLLPPEAVSYEWAGDRQPVASNATPEGRARNRRVEVEVWYDETRPTIALEEFVVAEEIKRVKVCRLETVCKLRFIEGHARRAHVQNLVAPLHFNEEAIEVTPQFIAQIRQAFTNLEDKQDVRVKFIGYTDDAPLTGRYERIYGTPEGLSKARARRVALSIQDALGLPTAAIDSDGRGTARPLASNETAQGRALNRRVEVEFSYNDPLQELPDEPQMCPEASTELVTRVYDPPWGTLPPLELEQGQAVIPPGFTDDLRRAMADVADKTDVRLRFVGYTRNERLDRRTAMVYIDDIGLSAARARRAMETIGAELELEPSQTEYEGRGYLHSDDVVNAGFIQGDTSQVVVQVVYDELAVLDDYEGVDIQRLTRELSPKNPFGLNLMRITVDGKPIDDPQRSSSDIQRCTDVALEEADIQFGFDNLRSAPRLSVTAEPGSVRMPLPRDGAVSPHAGGGTDRAGDTRVEESAGEYDGAEQTLAAVAIDTLDVPDDNEEGDESGEVAEAVVSAAPDVSGDSGASDDGVLDADRNPGGPTVRFRMYANYSHFIERAEVRIFDNGQSLQSEPLDVVDIELDGIAEWRPTAARFRAPAHELAYVLRAYGANGNFDETLPKPLWLVYADEDDLQQEPELEESNEGALLVAYGENGLARQNIGLSSGTVKVKGSGIPADHQVWVAGRPVPVDAQGSFVTEDILPTGTHTVEVAVLDQFGNGEMFLRDLEFEPNDWFYVGMADVTLAQNRTRGPIDELQGDNAPFDYDATSYGRLAFYLNGKFGDHWRLATSADTREEPLEDLFSNFMSKSPDALFRRIDPDYYYPTFGDDAVVEEMAPTLGKFYVKLSHEENYGLWGNFKVGYMNNELAQVDRGLYGGNFHYQSSATTSFGEQRFAADLFGAEPGTIASREEFRGTGGSLYFLRRQDILAGSERVRIELRDQASGLVMGVVNLRPTLDYDIDYLQGRILLSEPLASSVDDELLVRSGALDGDEAYLVVRYEYTPAFEDIDTLAAGGQVHYWLNDYLKVGLTANENELDGTNSSLNAADVTVRKSAETWLKLQSARSEGLISGAVWSGDGGFGFSGLDDSTFADAEADAYRADVSVGFGDFFDRGKGRVSLYLQNVDAGYSAPGLATLTGTEHYGGTFRMPVTEKLSVRGKSDTRIQEQGLETEAQELDIGYQLSEKWELSTGVRKEQRIDRSPTVPLTQEQGERTDAVVQIGYDSKAKWRAYSFVQDTLSVTGDREENGRIGTGASYRLSDRFRIDAEVSNGDLGAGGKLGTNYLHNDRTSLYLNYTLENERTDNGLRSTRGSEGNLVGGVKTRLSDSTSVYFEERYRSNDVQTGLTHAAGISLAPTERLNVGANTDIGTLKDTQTGAETERRAAGVRVGYGFDALQLSSGIEYRSDESQQEDASWSTRTTWLFRNSFKYQLSPSARLLGKLNHSDSDSSLGQFYDGGYTEAVLGYAYRPIWHDRLDALAKYTYFYNVPTTDQVTLQNTAAEFIQKSHIASLDLSYDLTRRWSVGGKYARRRGEVSLDRENPQFFDNTAHLYVLRADWRFMENWEGLIETRLLDMPDLSERRSGALIAISRAFGEHLKIGAGYNFTDFTDDLTDLSFDHRGAFITLTGAL